MLNHEHVVYLGCREPAGVRVLVQSAVRGGHGHEVVDPCAGSWAAQHAAQFANLAIR